MLVFQKCGPKSSIFFSKRPADRKICTILPYKVVRSDSRNNFAKVTKMYSIRIGTQVTPSSNLQLKKLRLCLYFCHVNWDNLWWTERLHFANSCRHMPECISQILLHLRDNCLPTKALETAICKWMNEKCNFYPFWDFATKCTVVFDDAELRTM